MGNSFEAEVRAPGNKSNHIRSHIKGILIVVGILAAVCVLTLLYYQQYLYYCTHFYAGTIINGMDCSDMTVEEAEQLLQRMVDQYAFTLTDREGRSAVITAPELSMKYASDGAVTALLLSQEPQLWILNRTNPGSGQMAVAYTFDSDAAAAWFSALPCAAEGIAPTDAHLEQDETGYWRVVPETEGSLLDTEKAIRLIDAAITEGETTLNLAETDCYLHPAVTADDEALNAEAKARNNAIDRQKKIDEITDVTVSMQLAGDNGAVSVLDPAALKTMIKDDPGMEPSVSMDKVTEWVRGWAAENHLLDDDSLFVNCYGQLMHLDQGSDTGWHLDVEATAKAVCEAVKAKENTTVEAVLVNPDNGALQAGSTYVEIIIPEQRMLCYENGVLKVDTPVVTGAVVSDLPYETATPTNGIWHIFYKAEDYHMKGPRQDDGSYEYELEVAFWMPFNGDVGIHDLEDRTEFGGDIYLIYGSHGCINTPYDAAAEIYRIVSVGTPVIVWGDNPDLGQNNAAGTADSAEA